LRQSFNIIALGMPTNDGPLLFPYAADRRHDSGTSVSSYYLFGSAGQKSSRPKYQRGPNWVDTSLC
jgi:hypothetical protein